MNPARAFPAVDGRLLAALAIVSAAVTAQQIALMQVLGWTHWHHFAYLVVAVALLGFGIAGTVLTLMRASLFRAGNAAVLWLVLATAVSVPIGVRLAQLEALAVDLPLVFFAPANTWRLIALFGLLLPPFLTGGLVTGILLAFHAHTPGRLYASSLAGAGAGGLLGLALAAHVTPARLAPSIGAVALVAAFFRWKEATTVQRVWTVAGALLIAVLWAAPGQLASSEFKPLSRVMDLPGARIVASEPSLRGWVQVVAAPALRPSPAVSFNFMGEIPPHPTVFVNGLPYGSLPPPAALQDGGWLDYTSDAAAFSIGTPRRVLLLENGPGGWPLLARSRGADRVTVVEPNNALVGLVTKGANPLASEWVQPFVRLVRSDARHFLRTSGESFDTIRLPTVGALGGTAGLGAAGEQFLLTREAVFAAWKQLSRDGVLSVTSFMDFPERNPLRLLATISEALEGGQLRPRSHVAAIRSWAAVTFLVRRSPWDSEAVRALRTFCDERGFDILLAPGSGRDEQQLNHQWQNPAFFDMVDQLVDGPREPLYATYPFLLRPTTDQRPYFSQFVRLSQLERVKEVFGRRAMPFFELGSLVVALTFVLLSVLGMVCIVLPLARRGWAIPGKTGVLLYFGGLGAGFMFMEIGAMLEAQAWLGSPIVAAALVITTLLLASGAGSLWSERLKADRRVNQHVLLLIVLSVSAAGAAHVFGADWSRALPAGAQIPLLLLLVAVPGFVMGMAFPLGLRRLSASQPEHVPWAWAINGCVSVATPAGATLLAMSAGFGAVFVAGAVAYSCAFLAARHG